MFIRTSFLRLLALMPFGIIAFAAKAAVQDSIDQKLVDNVRSSMQPDRNLIFERGIMWTTIDDARARFMSQKVESTEEDFLNLVQEMAEKGMLQEKGEFLLAKAPSQH